MSEIEWTSRAFTVLESLEGKIAFAIFRHSELLRQFPEMGSALEYRFPTLKGRRQLIFKRKFRIIYEFDDYEDTVYILAVQDCREKRPSPRDLKRDTPNGE